MRTLIAVLIAATLGSVAHAADVTDIPPELRADISIDYHYAYKFGSLEETWENQQWGYGRRIEAQHDVLPHFEFSPYTGVALTLGLDATPSKRWSFPTEGDIFCPEGYGCDGPSQMMYDPVTGSGSYANGGTAVKVPVEDIPEYKGGGLNGIWLGVALQPFSESYDRSHLVTWRIDIAMRTAAARNSWWTEREGGGRGAAPGGAAFKLGAAFSTDNDSANPYIVATIIHEGKFTLNEYRDTQGTVWWTDGTLNPADKFDGRAGIELITLNDKNTGARFAVDLYMGFGYRSWEDVPSGILLPSVLDQSKEIIVTHYDHIIGNAGLGLDGHFNEYAGFRLAFDAKYYTPHPLEHVYSVRSDYDTIEMGVFASMDVKIR